MVDYPTLASIAIIFQAIFTFALVYLTYQYTQATKRYAFATDKSLKMTALIFRASALQYLYSNLFEKRLEKLFLPIHNNQKLFEYLPNAFNEFEAMNINNFVAEIKPYTHLADEPLRTNLEKLMNDCGTLFGEEAEAKRRSDEYIKLKKEILEEVDEGIKKDKQEMLRWVDEARDEKLNLLTRLTQ